ARIVEEALVPTEKQNTSLWNEEFINHAQMRLQEAYNMSAPGRFQIEAAIESVHINRRKTGLVDWKALNKLYHALMKFAPSAGAMVAQSVVTANLHGPNEGLKSMAALEKETGRNFQPLWAAKAELFSRTGDVANAKECYDKAISLTTDATVIRFLENQKSRLKS
ncbi:MAG: hypothetical protein MI743_02105, partial [Sneathiellales bacterium]|nr:hypothetical protein [Sneathiellales bacterium]